MGDSEKQVQGDYIKTFPREKEIQMETHPKVIDDCHLFFKL